MIEADPMTIPSMVSRNRVLLARKLSTASLATSLNIIVDRALASVRSNELGLGGLVVAIALESYAPTSIAAVHGFLPNLLSPAPLLALFLEASRSPSASI